MVGGGARLGLPRNTRAAFDRASRAREEREPAIHPRERRPCRRGERCICSGPEVLNSRAGINVRFRPKADVRFCDLMELRTTAQKLLARTWAIATRIAIVKSISYLAILNVFASFLITAYVGGVPHVIDGRFYVNNHGSLREITE